ncbi:hypothetical protein Tco_1333490 [Tanacetum coccineum]
MACLAMITSRSSSLFKSKRTHDSINNVINAIVEVRICFHDVSIKTSQEHTIWKIGGGFALGRSIRLTKISIQEVVDEYRRELEGQWNMVPRFLENTQEIHSYEFMLNHKGDDKIDIFIGLNRDLTIEIKNESWNNRFVDFKETIEANVCEETLDVVGFVVGLINNTTFVNVAIFNGFVEFGNCGGNARDFGYFWDVGFGEGYIGGSGSWHFIT